MRKRYLDLSTSLFLAIALIKACQNSKKVGKPMINFQQLVAYREGSVGWAMDTVLFTRPGKRQIEMRHTFVLHLKNGGWKVVHAHYSFPVPDEPLPNP